MEFKKVLGLKDIIIMTIVANIGIRWIPVAAGIGPSSLLFWLLGALFFFLPLALIVAELSCAYPEAGGFYAWIHRALGEKYAFIAAWLYWINNIFYYPAILTFLASNLAYGLGKPDWANNANFIAITTIVSFWFITFISLLGLKSSKVITRIGIVLGLILPLGALIVLGFTSLILFKHSATAFNLANFIPNQGLLGNLSSLSMLMFAMAGIEVVTVFSNAVKQPEKNLPRGLLSGAALIFLLYVLGTLAMNFIASPNDIAKTTGLIQAFGIIDIKFNIAWFTKALAFMLVIAEATALMMWVTAPAIMFFACIPSGILPESWHRLNQRQVPQNALLAQGVLVSIIILMSTLLPSVSDMYQVLVLMATIVYFLPYLLLAFAYGKLRSTDYISQFKVPGKKFGTGVVVVFTFISVVLGILLSFMPSHDLDTHKAVFMYEAELILGPALFIGLGFLLYQFHKTSK